MENQEIQHQSPPQPNILVRLKIDEWYFKALWKTFFKKRLLFWIFPLVVISIVVLFFIIEDLVSFYPSLYTLLLALIPPLAIGFIVLFEYFLYSLGKRKLNKNKVLSSENIALFYFYDDFMQICERTIAGIDSNSTHIYLSFKKIIETDKFFIIYSELGQILALPKSGFELGTPDEFYYFLKTKVSHNKIKSKIKR